MSRYLWLLLGAGVTVVLDQLTKIWAVEALVPGGLPRDSAHIRTDVHTVFESWFNLRVAGNKGGAWGVLRDLPETWRVLFFVVVGIVAIVAIIAFYRAARGRRSLSVALTLILGGAIGNLIDRVRLGFVVDFIDWHYVDRWHFPTFNIADVAITIGLGLLFIDMIGDLRGTRSGSAEAVGAR